ncbi:hypothetical protein ZIOFF_066959 [Zingiber officinale]|uniref:gibberellin 2beta-dioxygenase n=2 Tax=Zingiber officinale TaxID=94328 RepID=A0A8J5C5P9_ZINOF|nr:hypothetical protein ZIOFF_066959 [Zingiber officinale]
MPLYKRLLFSVSIYSIFPSTMVVLSSPSLDQIPLIRAPKAAAAAGSFSVVPAIDLSKPDDTAARLIVKACQDLGLFKVTNHGVSLELMRRLEAEAVSFFSLPLFEKQRSCLPHSFGGYGNKSIGANGDVGWLEYLLFAVTPKQYPFSSTLREYLSAIRKLAQRVLELMAEGLAIQPRDALSKLVMGEQSDGLFRLNHYPPCPLQLLHEFNSCLTGFGEHTDPQVISILRSNNTSGLQISLKEGSWIPILPDEESFFINVGDALQVLTNGRFRSVRHRVAADGRESRVSMIYFFGPALGERIAPLPQAMRMGEQSRYREFTWEEYKKAAYGSRLSDDRLGLFEKSTGQ